MGVVVAETGGGQAVPAGVYSAVCSKVFDLGQQEGYDPGTTQHKVALVWELDEAKDNGDRFTMARTYTASLNEKAKLRQDLEAWRGRRFTADELQGFDLDNIIGAPCQLSVVEYTKQNGQAGTKISAVMPLGKGQTPIEPRLPTDYMPEWVAKALGVDPPAHEADTFGPDDIPGDDGVPF